MLKNIHLLGIEIHELTVWFLSNNILLIIFIPVASVAATNVHFLFMWHLVEEQQSKCGLIV